MFLPQLEPVQVRLAAGSQEEDCGCVRKLPLLLYAWKNAHQLIVRLIAIVNHMKSWWAVNFGSGQMLCVPTNPLFTIFKKEYDRPVIPSSNSLCRVKWSTRRLLWPFAELTLPSPPHSPSTDCDVKVGSNQRGTHLKSDRRRVWEGVVCFPGSLSPIADRWRWPIC